MNPQQQEFDTALSGLTPTERATYTKANPNVNVGGVQQSLNTNGIYTPIISTNLLGNVTPFKVSPFPVGTVGAGFGAELTSLSNSSVAEADKADALLAQQKADTIKTQGDTTVAKKGIMDFLGLRKGENTLTNEAYSSTNDLGTTVDETGKKLRNVNNQINAIDISTNEQLKQLKANFRGTTSGYNDAYNAIVRDSASSKADLYIDKLMAQGDYDSAKSIADRKVSMLMEQDKMNYDKLLFDYTENKDLFTKSEQRQFELMADNRKRELDKKATDLKTLNDTNIELLKSANEQNAPQSIKDAIARATTVEGKIQAAGVYAGNILDRQIKSQQLANAKLEGQKLIAAIEENKPLTGEYASVINGAAGLVANVKKQQVKSNISYALANGNFSNAYAEIANAVSDGLTGTPKTKFDDARTDIGIMSGMRTAIKNYSDAGGDMNLLIGTSEKIKKNLGIDSGKASALATQLWREFQTYRSNMTGAAFTPQESRDYASVNPTLGKSLDLNLSVIDGAMSQLENRITSTVNARIPDAKKIYDSINKVGSVLRSPNGTEEVNISELTPTQIEEAKNAGWK